MKYADYLLSDHWRALKGAAMTKAKGRCEACKETQFLHGHHLTYRNPLTLCTVEDIVILCKTCHFVFHENEHGLKEAKGNRPLTIARIKQCRGYSADCDFTPKKKKRIKGRVWPTREQRIKAIEDENKAAIAILTGKKIRPNCRDCKWMGKKGFCHFLKKKSSKVCEQFKIKDLRK